MRDAKRAAKHLRDLELFAGCSKREVKAIERLSTLVEAPAGRVLIAEGAHGREFIIVAQGEARVTRGTHEVATLHAGDFAGEMALLDQAPRSATVTAVTPVSILVCNAAEFSEILRVSPTVAGRINDAALRRREAAAAAAA